MIKLALIGLGNMGKLHLNNIIKLAIGNLCELSCVCDKDKELTDMISSKLSIKGFYSVEEMIISINFDAAIVAITSVEHFKVSKLLIENNKPILIEKPVVVSIKEAEELQKLSKEKSVLISPGYTEVYNSVTTGIIKYLQNKDNFNYIDFYRIGQKSKRNDSKDIDVIQDLMTHDLAVLSQIIDVTNISNVSGNLSTFNLNSKMYDLSNVSINFDNGIIARFLCDRGSSIKIRRFNISNEEIYGEFNFMNQTAKIMKKGNIEAFGNNIWYSQNYEAVNIRYSNNPLEDELKDFIISVENNEETKVSEKWFEITTIIENIREIVYNQNLINYMK